MNVPRIAMSREEALRKMYAYQRAMRRSKNPELAAAEAGYAALADGCQLLDLNQAIGAGGWTPEGHPAFAVARADRRTVRYDLDGSRWLRFEAGKNTRTGGPTLRRSIPLIHMPKQDPTWRPWRAGEAMVPLIPADVREEARTKARFVGERHWFILWEAVWVKVPPKDPILLEHLAGSLYVVLAQWDLTELERALMQGRLGS